MPYLDVSGVYDEERGTLTFFAVNRHGEKSIDFEASLHGFGEARLVDHQVMTSADLEAANTLKSPKPMMPAKGKGAKVKDGLLTAVLPPYSYQMLRLSLAAR